MNFKKFISGVSALTIAASAFAGMAVTANAAVSDTPAIDGSYNTSYGQFEWSFDGIEAASGLTSAATNSSYTKKIENPADSTENVELTFVPKTSSRNTNGGINRYDGIINDGIHIVAMSAGDNADISDRYIKVTPSLNGYFVCDLEGKRINGNRNDYYVNLYMNDVTGTEGTTYSVTKDNVFHSAATYGSSFSKEKAYYYMQAGHTYVLSWIGGSNNNVVTISNVKYSPIAAVNANVEGIGTIKTFSEPLVDGAARVCYEKYIEYNGQFYEVAANSSQPYYAKDFTNTTAQTATYTVSSVDYAIEGEYVDGTESNAKFPNIFANGKWGRIQYSSFVLDWSPSVDTDITLSVCGALQRNETFSMPVYIQDSLGNNTDTNKTLSWEYTNYPNAKKATDTFTVPAGGKILLYRDSESRTNAYVDYATITITPHNIEEDPDITGGTIDVSSTAKTGKTVTVTATPDPGYVLDKIYVNGEEISGNTFTMPNNDVTVSATFSKVAPPTAEAELVEGNITDDTGYTGGDADPDAVYSVYEATVTAGTNAITSVQFTLNDGAKTTDIWSGNITSGPVIFGLIVPMAGADVNNIKAVLNGVEYTAYTK